MNSHINLILLLSFFFGSCSINRKEAIEILDIKSNAEFFMFESNGLEHIGRTVKIISYNNQTMFVFLKKRSLIENKGDSNGNIISQTVKRVDTSYIYYIIKNGSDSGRVYGRKSAGKPNGERFELSSFLKSEGLGNDAFKNYSRDLGKPIEVIRTNNHQLTKKYLIGKKDSEYPDSIYRYFDRKLKKVKFTFSKSQDEDSNSKLVKIKTVYNPVHTTVQGKIYDIPRRETNIEMSLGTFPIDSIRLYFDRFSRESLK